MIHDLTNTSLVIATYNEKESIAYVLDELKDYNFHEIIIVDKASTDGTLEILNNYPVTVLQQENEGWGSAVIQGFNKASGEFITYMDGDGSYNPRAIIEMNALSRDYDFLCGSRYKHKNTSEDDTFFRAIGNKLFTLLTIHVLKLKITDSLFFYPYMKNSDYSKIKPISKYFGICIEIPLLLARQGLTYDDVLSLERKRYGGITKVRAISDGLKILFEVLKFIK